MTWMTSNTVNSSLLTTYLIRRFIPALEDELQFEKFTTKATLPSGMGNIARWNIWNSPPENTTALTEGTVTGNEITSIATTGTDSTIAEYGEFIVTSRMQEYMSVPGSRAELSNRLNYGAARSIDALVRDQALNVNASTWFTSPTTNATPAGLGSTPQRGGATTAAAVSATYIPGRGSASAIIGAAKELRNNSALGFTGVSGHPSRHFAAILTPTWELDMITEATTGRMTWAEAVTDVPGQMGQTKWVNGFMGSVYGTACYRTQALTLSTITNSADNNVILAEGGIGSVSMIDADPQIYVNVASSQDVGNPYRNRNTIAWHIYYATSFLDSNRVIRMYSAAT